MENQHTIYVAGAGAIGKALAVVLKTANRNVVLLRASTTAVELHEETITMVLPDASEVQATIGVASPDQYQKLNGIVVLTNKSYGNQQISTLLRGKTDNLPIVILQNGLGVEEVFIQDGFPEIYRCVLFATSQLIEANKVSFKPVSASPIGTIKGSTPALSGIVEHLNTELFPFKAEENIQKIIWKKAIINCVFNSICPLIEADNGIFYRDADVLNLALRVIDECIQIAHAYHIGLSQPEILESLLMISKLSVGQLISSYQDIINKRPTEIETLNFAIVKMAEMAGKAHLIKETRLLGELIKLKSELNRNHSTKQVKL